jgi:hypothetical protein
MIIECAVPMRTVGLEGVTKLAWLTANIAIFMWGYGE